MIRPIVLRLSSQRSGLPGPAGGACPPVSGDTCRRAAQAVGRAGSFKGWAVLSGKNLLNPCLWSHKRLLGGAANSPAQSSPKSPPGTAILSDSVAVQIH